MAQSRLAARKQLARSLVVAEGNVHRLEAATEQDVYDGKIPANDISELSAIRQRVNVARRIADALVYAEERRKRGADTKPYD